MVTNNKVLTVSYGTFSCTLEGFEDSFDTMKAIAEYFRDLAADDRYFGAEPPTPDAEMLARIAEREIERRVRARVDHGAIVLSAADDAEEDVEASPVDTTPPESAPAPKAASEPERPTVSEMPQPALDEEEDDAAAALADAVAEDVEEAEAEDVAQELETSSEEQDFEPQVEIQAEIEEAVLEDVAEIEPEIVAPQIEIAAEDDSDAVAEIEPEIDEQVAPVQAVIETAHVVEDVFDRWDDEDEDDIDPEYEENSIAAKLERIRAVVNRVGTDQDDDFSEDEHAELFAESAEHGDDIFADIDEAFAQDHDDDEAQAPEATAEPMRARVVRMKRADFEEAVASGLLEAEEFDEDENDTPDVQGTDTSLTPEDEAELLAELAEVEAELSREDVDTSAPFVLTDAVSEQDDSWEDDIVYPDEDAPAARQLSETHSAEEDLSRLMAKAETELEEPEGSRRRRAIAHLRAAVQATKAEKAAGQDTATQDVTEAYRVDLASVVRGPAKRDRSEAPPLKLVAAQRIDSPEPAAAKAETPDRAPVRPRRLSAEQIDREEAARVAMPVGSGASDHDEFTDYARGAGARNVAELVEAAAAYLTFVEGHERFSRPMLMRMTRDANEAEFSREVGLRSFGQLLRDKKIEKVAGGRFTATSSIRFQPDDRAFG